MKKTLLSFLLIIGLVFIVCGCGTSTNEMVSENEDVATNIEEPVSDVTDGTGLQGTWKGERDTEGTSETIVLAFNSDDTFEFYTKADEGGLFGVTGAALVGGTYKVDGDKVEMTYDTGSEQLEGAETDLDTSNVGSFTYKITDDNKMTVTFPNDEVYDLERQTDTTDSADASN